MTPRVAAAPAPADLTSLSRRVLGLSIVRAGLVALLLAFGLLGGGEPVQVGPLTGLYLATTMALAALTLTGRRALCLAGYGAGLLLDGVYLTWQHEVLGPLLGADVPIAAYLVAVCLLASFRTGLKIAVWQCLLLVTAVQGERQGIFGTPAAMSGLDRGRLLAIEVAMLWVVVLITSATAAINERELRRRRYDAEAMMDYVLRLHGAHQVQEALGDLLSFIIGDLDAARALVCRHGDQGPELLAGESLPDAGSRPPAGPSALLAAADAAAAAQAGPTLALRVDPGADPLLAELLAPARRLVVLPLYLRGERAWLVLTVARRGRWAERRVISGLRQTVAVTELALSRVELLENAERAAALDGLTGVANRRSLDAFLDRLRRGAPRSGRALDRYAVVLVDVDHFKAVNDVHGHPAGDAVLQGVARALADVVVGDGMLARYGGEEFCFVLPGAGTGQAAELAERARRAVEAAPLPVRVTASFGVAVATSGADPADVVGTADQALIHAKRTGRNRVIVAGTYVPVPAGASDHAGRAG